MKTFLIIVIILALGGFGYYQYKQNQQPSEQVNTQQSNMQVTPIKTTTEQPQQKMTNASVDAGWKAMSSTQLLNIASKENISLEPDFGVSLSQTVDLTGDGVDEGIFAGNGGNNGLSFILIKKEDGSSAVAKQKNKDGIIASVGLYEIGRVMVSENFKLLPAEHGFYTVSKEIDQKADNSESSHFICKTNGVNAYQWNFSTKLFEWNQSLTAKYTAEVCK